MENAPVLNFSEEYFYNVFVSFLRNLNTSSVKFFTSQLLVALCDCSASSVSEQEQVLLSDQLIRKHCYALTVLQDLEVHVEAC